MFITIVTVLAMSAPFLILAVMAYRQRQQEILIHNDIVRNMMHVYAVAFQKGYKKGGEPE